MAKTFITERDIQDLARKGVTSLVLDDDTVLTDLARDKAMQLGIRLVTPSVEPEDVTVDNELIRRVKEKVMARLGSQFDPALVDSVIARVVRSMK